MLVFKYSFLRSASLLLSSHWQVLHSQFDTNAVYLTKYNGSYFTLDSTTIYNINDFPSFTFFPHFSSQVSPANGGSVFDSDSRLKTKIRERPESAMDRHHTCFYKMEASLLGSYTYGQIPIQNLRQVLVLCAQAVESEDLATTAHLMNILGNLVSVSGSPIERLGAYLLEALRARLESSGFNIYKMLRCEPPTSAELMSYMSIIYQDCPYYKFAYTASNIIIQEEMANEDRIHIIDFQIAMGTQWVSFIESVSRRPSGPPSVRITGVDDSNSAHARGGGLEIVGARLTQVAESHGVPFEFNAAAISGCQVERADLKVREGEAIAVTFPYMLHHMPDESVSTENHRDRLLHLIKSLSPKVVTLIEQESNTNTALFLVRFHETLEYYMAMFESIDVARARNDKERINAEQQCLARDIVNIIACEGGQRVERHELLRKWKARFSMAGFDQSPLSRSVREGVEGLLRGYHENYRLVERDGSVYLGWKNRDLVTCSAWK